MPYTSKGIKRKSTKHTQNVCYDTVTKHFETEWSYFLLKINTILATYPAPFEKLDGPGYVANAIYIASSKL